MSMSITDVKVRTLSLDHLLTDSMLLVHRYKHEETERVCMCSKTKR